MADNQNLIDALNNLGAKLDNFNSGLGKTGSTGTQKYTSFRDFAIGSDDSLKKLADSEELLKSTKKIIDFGDSISKLNSQMKKAKEEEQNSLEKFGGSIEEAIKFIQDYNDKEDEYHRAEGERKKELGEELKKSSAKYKDATKATSALADANNIAAKKIEESGKMFLDGAKSVKNGFFGLGRAVKNLVNTLGATDQAAFNYAKSAGLSKGGAEQARSNAINLAVSKQFGLKYGAGSEDLIKMQEGYSNSVGRRASIDNEGLEQMAAMTTVLGEAKTSELTQGLENFGIDVERVGKLSGKMFAEAAKSGISLSKYSDNFSKNLKLAQNYTFKNGIEGLKSMAKKATEIKLDMQQVANFAEKVNTVEGVVQVGAQLQVLGGSFAQFANPLAMLNESLTDMEGLQDRMVSMFGNMGSWNSKTGQVEVSSLNKQRIRAAASAMGMDYGSVMEMVNTNARRDEIGKQLNGSSVDKDTRDLIKNIGSVDEKGAYVVNKEGKKEYIDKGSVNGGLSDETLEYLKESNKSEKDQITGIATDLRGAQDLLKNTEIEVKNIAQFVGEQGGLLGYVRKGYDKLEEIYTDFVKGTLEWIKENKNLAKGIAMGILGLPIIGNIGKMISGLYKMFRGGGSNILSRLTGSGVTAEAGGATTSGAASGASNVAKGSKFAKLGKFGKFLKTPVTGAARIGGSAFAGITSGIATGIKEFGGDNNHSKARKIGTTAGSAIGGAAGAALGSLLGPLGTIAGGYIGSKLGEWAGSGFANDKRRQREKDKRGLSSLKGDYRVKQIREIEGAIATGQISDKLRDKLIKNGDTDVLSQIEEARVNNSGEATPGNVTSPESISKSKIENATINVQRAIIKANIDSEDNSFIPKTVAKTNEGVGINELGVNEIKIPDINLNISGSIKLEGLNGMSKNLGEDLLNSEWFKKGIATYIQKEFEKKFTGGLNNGKLGR